MFKINEVNDNLPIYHDAQLLALEDFKANIIAKQSICRNDVLSLEAFVGGAISNVININRYSSHNSSVEYERTLECVGDIVARHKKVDNGITVNMLHSIIFTTKTMLKELKETLFNYHTANTATILETASNNAYTIVYSYCNKDELVDIKNISLVELIKYDSHYKFFSLVTNNKFNRKKAEELVNDVNDIMPLMCALVKTKLSDFKYNDVEIRTITLTDLISVLNNAPAIISDIESMLSDVESDLRDFGTPDYNWIYQDNQRLSSSYRKYKNIVGLLSDNITQGLLKG